MFMVYLCVCVCAPSCHFIPFPFLQVPPGWVGSAQASVPAGPPGPQGFSALAQGPQDTESRVPVINLKDGTRLAGDDAPKRKDLDQWLKEHPGFVADVGAFIPVSSPFLPTLLLLLLFDLLYPSLSTSLFIL